MLKIRGIVTFIVLLGMTACQSALPPTPVAWAPPEPPPAPAPLPIAAEPLRVIATRDFLVQGTSQPFNAISGFPLKGIVLLSRMASGKNKKVCNEFVTLTETAVAPLIISDAKFVPTYWPLRNDVADRANCEQLLASYDYGSVGVVRERYGVPPESKGPILVVVNPEGRFAFVDLSNANNGDISRVVRGWGKMMAQNGLTDVSFRSRNLGSVLRELACNTGRQIVTQHVPLAGADPTNPETFGFNPATLKWSRPSLFKVGALILGGPFMSLVCT